MENVENAISEREIRTTLRPIRLFYAISHMDKKVIGNFSYLLLISERKALFLEKKGVIYSSPTPTGL